MHNVWTFSFLLSFHNAMYVSNVYSMYELFSFFLCPGKKDFVSVHINGVKVHKQKRLILVRMKELYLEFKKLNQNAKLDLVSSVN